MNLVIAKVNMGFFNLRLYAKQTTYHFSNPWFLVAFFCHWLIYSAVIFWPPWYKKNEPSLLSFAQGQIYLLTVSLFAYFFRIENKCKTAITYIFWLSILLCLRDHLEVLCWILDFQSSVKLQVSTNQPCFIFIFVLLDPDEFT